MTTTFNLPTNPYIFQNMGATIQTLVDYENLKVLLVSPFKYKDDKFHSYICGFF